VSRRGVFSSGPPAATLFRSQPREFGGQLVGATAFFLGST
jgi:hypothetical protein